MAHDSLGFLINIKKSVLPPRQTLEFLGVVINSKEMILTLLVEKNKIVEQFQFPLWKPLVPIKESKSKLKL